MGVYCLHHNSRIPFESAIWVFDDEAMGSYPWGRTAYEVFIDSIKTLAPEGGSYTISGITVALLIWAYESVACFGENFGRVVNNEDVPLLRWGGKRTRASFDNLLAVEIKGHGEVRVRRMVLKDSIEEMFPKWPGEPDDPQIKQKKVKTQNESEAAATGKGSSEKEGSKDLEMENKATLTTINLAKELDKESGVKRTLAKEFGSVAKATDLDSQHLDFIVVSPAKATKDDKDAKVPAYGRGCRGRRTVKDEDAADKKKAAQADAALKRKEKAEKKEAEASKKEAELKKKQEAELKKQKQAESKTKKVTPPRAGVTRCKVQKSGDDSVFADVTDAVVAEENEFEPESDVERSEVIRSAVIKEYREKSVRLSPKRFSMMAVSSPAVFPYVGENGTTCMRKNVTPSSVIYDPLAPVDRVLFEKLMHHIKGIPHKPPAPADKPAVLSADHESDFYSILIHERPWPEKEYGWVFDNFKIKPSMFIFKGNGYEDMLKVKLPDQCPANLKWYEDVDHLYGCLQTGGNHWVAYHVDLKKEKIDCYDPIFGEATPESEQRILNSFKPLTHMIPVMLSDHIPANIRAPSKKKFSFRRRSKRYIPQNTQIGDCGVYSLKFVECLALGVTFDGINDKNIQGLRMKMAADILDEGGNTVMSSLLAN
ncbi:PREDICTED: uncharacterized protein LOC106338527 [Brassica oleracea var. oleracea]|uniref:uncharacterized protein LOC106338527 n=1 Tax=Brassica oleracea var. oleracea TaxID=109376 RepID=UPI0006A716A7|nr:PREDICTED: uncharacterized protein LOC106338527 [Brassica oleracea var. oleracea]